MAEPNPNPDSKPAAQQTPAPSTATTTSTSAPPPTTQPANDAPDPDSDDLDELDDMLDEFSATHAAPAPSSSGPGRPAPDSKAPAPAGDDTDPDQFAEQLAKEMATLMGQLEESPEMKAQMESVMAQLAGAEESPEGAAAAAAAVGEAAATAVGAGEGVEKEMGKEEGKGKGGKGEKADKVKERVAGEENFQETIRKTMERMKASGDQASAAAAEGSGAEGDLLAQLMQELASGEGGEGSEEEFSKMLMGMMEQLTNKEILYEPMKDLNGRFPEWMAKNEGKVGEEDWKRYTEQRKLVGEIVGRFEKEGYSDANAADREFIVERMQQMQALGSPPGDLVGDMKETQDMLGEMDPGCAQQ